MDTRAQACARIFPRARPLQRRMCHAGGVSDVASLGVPASLFDRPPGVPIVDVLGPQRPPRLPTHSASTTAAIAGTPPFNRQDAGTRSLIGGVAVAARPAGRTVVVSTDGRYPQSANRRVPNVAWPFRPHLRADGGQAAARSAPHRRARRRVPRSAVRELPVVCGQCVSVRRV